MHLQLVRDDNVEEIVRDLELDVLSRTLYGEARESYGGKEAIACVILNRLKLATENSGKHWWGNTIISICQKPYQFKSWSRNEELYQEIQRVTDNDMMFVQAQYIARRALEGTLGDDVTLGATHYHIRTDNPYWSHDETPTASIGDYIFYNLGP